MKKHYLFSFLFIIPFIFNLTVSAQSAKTKFRRISVAEGLSQSTVGSILQDKKGFMWFATSDGLNRYDGYSFKLFRHIDGDTTTIPENNIRRIFLDNEGNIWISPNQLTKVCKFNPVTEKVTLFKSDPSNPKNPNYLSSQTVIAACQDKDGDFWFGTPKGLDRMNHKTGRFDHFVNEPGNQKSLSNDTVICVFQDRTGYIWAGTLNGLNRLDLKTMEITRFRHDPKNKKTISSDSTFAIFQDSEGTLWMGTYGGGLNKFDPVTGSFTAYSYSPNKPDCLSNNFITSICEDEKSRLWIGTTAGGLNIFDKNSGRFTHFKYDPYDKDGIGDNRIQSVYIDRSGIVWIGTSRDGVNYIDRNKELYINYMPDPKDPFAIKGNTIRMMTEDYRGNIWISTDAAGVNILDRKTGKFSIFKNLPIDTKAFRYDRLQSIYGDNSGAMWFGTLTGLKRMDLKTGKVTTIKVDAKDPLSMRTGLVSCLAGDRNGDLLVGTTNGLHIINRATGKVERFDDPKFPEFLKNIVVLCAYRDSKGIIWIGAQFGGLVRLDPVTGKAEQFTVDAKNPKSISSNDISFIYEDSRGMLWLSTSNGLNLMDRSKREFIHFTTEDGLHNNNIWGIHEDKKGNLWFGTNGGGLTKLIGSSITGYNKERILFRTYFESDGIQGNEFNQYSSLRTTDGMMFFGGMKGLTAFNPDNFEENTFAPPVYITDLKIFNQTVKPGQEGSPLSQSITDTKEIIFTYKQSVISFEFTAINYHGAENNQYAYMMEGFDKDWNYCGTRRFATYTNLNPGEYIFRVKASNSDGIWNEAGTSIKIIILPPFWRTWWAYSLYIILTGLTIWGVFRFQLNRHKQKARLIETELRAEAAELQAKAAEAQARMMQAENERKTRELEEARELQMSLLPKEVPQLDNLDIAVFMKTATEVGGDYYDFAVDEDGELTAVIGDATGHGLKAGTMVTVVKGLYIAHARERGLTEFFRICSNSIRQMNLGRLHMALSMVKIKGNKLVLSSAGIPPVYIYRKSSEKVEEHLLEGAPLGAFTSYNYREKEIELKSGDTILMLTDGLPERSNEKDDMLEYSRVKEEFGKIACSGDPQQIIERLYKYSEEWGNGTLQDDDITLMVIKVK